LLPSGCGRDSIAGVRHIVRAMRADLVCGPLDARSNARSCCATRACAIAFLIERDKKATRFATARGRRIRRDVSRARRAKLTVPFDRERRVESASLFTRLARRESRPLFISVLFILFILFIHTESRSALARRARVGTMRRSSRERRRSPRENDRRGPDVSIALGDATCKRLASPHFATFRNRHGW